MPCSFISALFSIDLKALMFEALTLEFNFKKNFNLLIYTMKIFNDPKLDKFFDPKTGLKSIDKFAKKHKLTKAQIKKLKSLETFQMHEQPMKKDKPL